MQLVQKERNIITETCLKEACQIIHCTPQPQNEGDPFRTPADVAAEALLLTKTLLKGFTEALVFLDELVPPTTAPAPEYPKQNAPEGKAATNNEIPQCPKHGDMVWRTSEPGAEKQWKGWFCKLGRDECDTKPIWVRDKKN